MALRFWRRLNIAPGISLNLSKSGASVSMGPRGAKLTVGKSGLRGTAGLPGTGLFYTQKLNTSQRTPAPRSEPPPPPEDDRLDLGFFESLMITPEEKAFVAGCRAWREGDTTQALLEFTNAATLADAAFLGGFLAFKAEDLPRALKLLTAAVERHQNLGRLMEKYDVGIALSVPITEMLNAELSPGLRGALLGRVEVLQQLGRPHDAVADLQRLHRLEPEDAVVALSYVELLFESAPEDRKVARQILRYTEDCENTTAVNAALLYYRGRALQALDLHEAARKVLTVALRRRKDRPEELLQAIRYARANSYAALGKGSRERSDLERIFAEDSNYADVARRLGVA